MTDKAYANRRFVAQVKTDLFRGIISYEVARRRIQPIVDNINKTARELAEKHGVKYSPITPNSLLR